MGQHRRQLGVLRQLADPLDYWHDWLAEHDYRASFQDSVTVELWLVPEMFIAEVSGKPGLAGRLTKLYVELCVRHARNRYQRSLRNLSQLEVLCDSDLPNRGAGFDIKLPRWNTFGKLMIIATDKSVERVAQMELEVELTSRLLELNRARRDLDGRWPTDLPGSEQSTACADDRWLYDVNLAGDMSIALSRELEWLDYKYVLPVRFKG